MALTLALDCDGVLTACAQQVHAAAERILRRQISPPDFWHSYDFAQAMDLDSVESEYLFAQINRENSLCWKIGFLPGAQEFVNALLAQDVDVVFVTAHWRGMTSWVTAREELLNSAFPKQDVIFTHAKQRVTCDLIVDDRTLTCLEMRDRALLFTQPWNKSFNADKAGVTRVDSYAEVLQLTETW